MVPATIRRALPNTPAPRACGGCFRGDGSARRWEPSPFSRGWSCGRHRVRIPVSCSCGDASLTLSVSCSLLAFGTGVPPAAGERILFAWRWSRRWSVAVLLPARAGCSPWRRLGLLPARAGMAPHPATFSTASPTAPRSCGDGACSSRLGRCGVWGRGERCRCSGDGCACLPPCGFVHEIGLWLNFCERDPRHRARGRSSRRTGRPTAAPRRATVETSVSSQKLSQNP